MSSSTLRTYIVGLGIVALFVFGGAPLRLERAAPYRSVREIRAVDAERAIVVWNIDDEQYVAVVGLDGADRWRTRIGADATVRSLNVTDDAVFVRYSQRNDEWAERIGLDGRVRWHHLIAEHPATVHDFASGHEPRIVNGALLEEVKIDEGMWVRDAFDVRTGWPVREQLQPDPTSAQALFEPYEGRPSTQCVVDGSLLILRTNDDSRVLELTANLEQRWQLTVLQHASDEVFAAIDGCGTWDGRTVVLLGMDEHGAHWTQLVEVDQNGALQLTSRLPSVLRARTSGMFDPPHGLAGKLPRFVPLALGDDSHVAHMDAREALAVLDLETGHIAWRGPARGKSLQILGESERWYVAEEADRGGEILLSIDGRNGTIDAVAHTRLYDLQPQAVRDGTIWLATGDNDAVFPLDGRTLGPRGFRAHMLALQTRVPRPVERAQRVAVGL